MASTPPPQFAAQNPTAQGTVQGPPGSGAGALPGAFANLQISRGAAPPPGAPRGLTPQQAPPAFAARPGPPPVAARPAFLGSPPAPPFVQAPTAATSASPHEFSKPSGYLGSWEPAADPREACPRLERLRKGYAQSISGPQRPRRCRRGRSDHHGAIQARVGAAAPAPHPLCSAPPPLPPPSRRPRRCRSASARGPVAICRPASRRPRGHPRPYQQLRPHPKNNRYSRPIMPAPHRRAAAYGFECTKDRGFPLTHSLTGGNMLANSMKGRQRRTPAF